MNFQILNCCVSKASTMVMMSFCALQYFQNFINKVIWPLLEYDEYSQCGLRSIPHFYQTYMHESPTIKMLTILVLTFLRMAYARLDCYKQNLIKTASKVYSSIFYFNFTKIEIKKCFSILQTKIILV